MSTSHHGPRHGSRIKLHAPVIFLGVTLITVVGCALQSTDPEDESSAESENVAEATSALTATCFCKISKDNLSGKQTATGVLADLTSAVNKTYEGLNPQNQANQNDCYISCYFAADKYEKSPAIAAAACAASAPDGTYVNAYSAVGTQPYSLTHPIGTLTNTPAQTETRCPVSWLANTTNVDGGVSTDGRCKKVSAWPMSITPVPPNGTTIGTYGFTWGNTVYAWGTQANGGAAVTTIIAPAICAFP